MTPPEFDIDTLALEHYEDGDNVDDYTKDIDEVGLWGAERAVFAHFVPKQARVLDLGCGAGRTTFGLYDVGWRNITGLDRAEGMIAAARHQATARGYDIPLVCADARRLPFDDSSFDCVFFSFNGLMTLPGSDNRERVLDEVARVLRPAGWFILTTQDRQAPEDVAFWRKRRADWQAGIRDRGLREYGDIYFIEGGRQGVLHIPDRDEFGGLLEKKGFVIELCAPRGTIWQEKPLVEKRAGSCLFWVVSKSEAH